MMNLRFAMVAVVVTLSLPGCTMKLREQAAARAAEGIAKAIPDDVHLRVLALAPIDGDRDGVVARALLARLTSDGRFRVIDREKQQTILQEQGRQLSAAVDRNSRIELGKLLGAEGLVFVRVLSSGPGLLSHNLSVHFRLDDLQRGTVAAAEQDIRVVQPIPYRPEIAVLLVCLVLVAGAGSAVGSYRRRSRRRRVSRSTERIGRARQKVVRTRQSLEARRSTLVAEKWDGGGGALRIDEPIRALRDLEQCLEQVSVEVASARGARIEKVADDTCSVVEKLGASLRERSPGGVEHWAKEVVRVASQAVGETR